ncbi:MAG: hypothetical protein WC967_15605 [Balneolaceae bacterium]
MKTKNHSSPQRYWVILPFVVLAAVIVVLVWRTQGFSAFTSYSYEFVKAKPIGKTVPEDLFILKDDSSRVELNSLGNHYTLVGIVYLKCHMVCPIINQRLHEIYRDLDLGSTDDENSNLEGIKPTPYNLQLMTLSFDYKRDSLSDLKAYKRIFFKDDNARNSDESATLRGRNWSFAVVEHSQESFIQQKLTQMGFWFYEYKSGMYNHSPYLYLIDPEGVIKQVYDPGKLSNRELIEQLKRDVL